MGLFARVRVMCQKSVYVDVDDVAVTQIEICLGPFRFKRQVPITVVETWL